MDKYYHFPSSKGSDFDMIHTLRGSANNIFDTEYLMTALTFHHGN